MLLIYFRKCFGWRHNLSFVMWIVICEWSITEAEACSSRNPHPQPTLMVECDDDDSLQQKKTGNCYEPTPEVRPSMLLSVNDWYGTACAVTVQAAAAEGTMEIMTITPGSSSSFYGGTCGSLITKFSKYRVWDKRPEGSIPTRYHFTML